MAPCLRLLLLEQDHRLLLWGLFQILRLPDYLRPN
jgi:hypothetical protein